MHGDLLGGLRVVEISQLIAASLCGVTLADYGAEVVKVEPKDGEYARTIAPHFSPGESAYFQMLNRGKRSIAFDYGSPEASDVLSRLVASADIVLENLGDAVSRLGLDAHAAIAARPDLVWCSVTGLGVGTAGRAIDPTLQSSMGMMALNGEAAGRPLRLPVPLVDFMTGMYAVQSILAAVMRVRAGGGGAHLDCALIDAAATLASSAGVYALSGEAPLRRMGTENHWYVPASNFATSDGRWVQIMTISEFHWWALCRALGYPEWIADERMADNDARVAHRALVHDLLAGVVATDTAEHWVRVIGRAGAFCEHVNEIEEAWQDPRLAERRLVAPVEGVDAFATPVASLARTLGPGRLPRAARLGQHSVEIVRGLGYDAAAVDLLLESGVLIDAPGAR